MMVSESNTVDTAILGAGIAGLGAAHAAIAAGSHPVVFEARERAGGLLDNIVIDGFVFDTAVHLSFAKEPEVREVFDRTPYITHDPKALCWDAPVWLKHPIQTNMALLPLAEKVELIAGLAGNKATGRVRNYHDWLVHQYGEPIAKRWHLLYTEKYWTIPASQLGTKWIGSRLRQADLAEVIAGALTTDTPNQYYVSEMRYPKDGGYRAFVQPLIDQADIRYSHSVARVLPKKKTIEFENGKTVRYRKLISTIPLPRLVEMMPSAPKSVTAAASTLFATRIDLISIGFRRPRVSPALWFYIYDRDILAARAYSPDWKSPGNVPAGCSAIQFEIYSSRLRPQERSVEELKRNTVEGLVKMRLATPDDILFVHHTHVPYANVVFDLGMEERRARVRKWIERQGIALAGRFGEWEYLWSNQSMMSGINAYRTASHS